jgi:hypothetical protein
VPFILIDAMLGAHRTRPLTVAGPRALRARMDAIREALFPGSRVRTPKFPVDWNEMEPGRAHRILDLVVTPERARHTEETNPTALRVQERAGDRIVERAGPKSTAPPGLLGCGRRYRDRPICFGTFESGCHVLATSRVFGFWGAYFPDAKGPSNNEFFISGECGVRSEACETTRIWWRVPPLPMRNGAGSGCWGR